MWMTRRVGRNTALTVSAWPLVLLGLFFVGTVVNAVSNTGVHLPSAVGFLIVGAPFAWLAREYRKTRIHVTQHEQLVAGCKQCAVEADTLREREAREIAREAQRAEMARLSRKYRA
jgi:hypothetical protein